MEPTRILEKPGILLVGVSFFGDPFSINAEWSEENEIGRLWNRLFAYMRKHPHSIKHVANSKIAYEVHVEHEETTLKGYFEVFVGVEVTQLEEVPIELLVKILPASTYAVFTLRGQQILSDWSREIYQHWLPGSGYRCAYPYAFQLYDERFQGLDHLDQSVLDLYIPLHSFNPVRV